MAYTTYMFNNINLCINNIYMLLNFIRHIYSVSLETHFFCILGLRHEAYLDLRKNR